MKRTSKKEEKLSDQMKAKAEKAPEDSETFGGEYPGNDEVMISTGSTLLDLAISGGRKRGGGVPGGIFCEIFGPSSAGKTVLLCEMAGSVQRKGGQVMFKDPEARLNQQFAQLFDLDVDLIDYSTPNRVPEVFEPIRSWKPDSDKVVNGIFADSLAALSTDMEMEDKDAYGMRRAKEFSEELRKTCRTLKDRNMILVASNQIRTNVNAGMFEEKYKAPGGHAPEFYASLRLRFSSPAKIKKSKKIKGKDFKKVIGVKSRVEVYKSSVWQPYNVAEITILFDYGIDDIRANLQFLKDYSRNTVYTLDGQDLHKSMDKSIAEVEKMGREGLDLLREETIDRWEEIQGSFQVKREAKIRL